MQQAKDFLDESNALHALIRGLSDDELGQATAFKGWTINAIIGHLHIWNNAADLSLRDGDAFLSWFEAVKDHIRQGTLNSFERDYLGDLQGQELVDRWRVFYQEMATRFGEADPSARVVWAGPSMSVRSSITARLMETWAHGQEIYDVLGAVRLNADRIRNIVILGVNTYGWTFKVNGLETPGPLPRIELTAPSGELWEFGEESDVERIVGPAEEFCQVVTQSRNIADTGLEISGPDATAWMSKAQCFAGRPEQPPAPGTRKISVVA